MHESLGQISPETSKKRHLRHDILALLYRVSLLRQSETGPPVGQTTPEANKKHRLRQGFLAFLFLVSPLLQPETDPPKTFTYTVAASKNFIGSELHVMSANVRSWHGNSGSSNLNNLVAAIDKYDVDLACLQEVDISGNQLEELHKKGFNILFSQTEHEYYGNAVISRYNIKQAEDYKLPPYNSDKPRGAMLVELPMSSGGLTLVNTHIATRVGLQPLQNRRILDITQSHHVDALCGDMNQNPSRLEASGFGKHFVMRNSTPNTYPYNDPTRPIDIVLSHFNCSPGTANSAYINSDHLAIVRTIPTASCQ